MTKNWIENLQKRAARKQKIPLNIESEQDENLLGEDEEYFGYPVKK